MAEITFRGTTYSSVRILAATYGAHCGNVVQGEIIETTSAYSISAFFVFLQLLKGEAHHVAQGHL
jgi:hypothetical protein